MLPPTSYDGRLSVGIGPEGAGAGEGAGARGAEPLRRASRSSYVGSGCLGRGGGAIGLGTASGGLEGLAAVGGDAGGGEASGLGEAACCLAAL
eukprot:2359000-Rhodomonas_salina.1